MKFEEAHGVLWESWHPFVPERTYHGRGGMACQVVYGAGTYGLDDGEEPVVMLGSRHCRAWSQGGYRNYVTAICRRYIRRKKVTFVSIGDWEKWLDKHLWPLLHSPHRQWCVGRQRASWGDLRRMVGLYNFVIEGVPTRGLEPKEAKAIRNLYYTMNKMRG